METSKIVQRSFAAALILTIGIFFLSPLSVPPAVHAQTSTIWTEDFEGTFQNGTNGWSVGDQNTAGTAAYWNDVSTSFGNRAPHSGSKKAYAAGTGCCSASAPSYRAEMIAYMTHSVDLTNMNTATLTLYHMLAVS
jgi:hypothetical protein